MTGGKDNKHIREREAVAELKTASEFRDEIDSGIDIEYRQTRLERVILIAVYNPNVMKSAEIEYHIEELERLAITAGAEVLDKVIQKRESSDPASYFGKGKATELAELVKQLKCDTIIVNDTLAPRVRRNLENIVDAKVIDRTALILDIFALHAKSKAGRIQIELAQLEYLLPRLRGWGQMMSRQGGGQVGGGAGMGSRGPGETQLEIDRRRITKKISILKRQLTKIKEERKQSQKQRKHSAIPSVAIVGYTNTGKSSLLNRLTGADIIIQDALFATLDTTTRALKHPKYTITDTVGFIQDLPTTLVEAFRSTLEEATDCDLILHIIDISSPMMELQINAVNDVLADIRSLDDANKVTLKRQENEILVFNKIDLVTDDELGRIERKYPEAVFISVQNDLNINLLKSKIEQKVLTLARFKTIEIEVPYNDFAQIDKIYRSGEIIETKNNAESTYIKAVVPIGFVM